MILEIIIELINVLIVIIVFLFLFKLLFFINQWELGKTELDITNTSDVFFYQIFYVKEKEEESKLKKFLKEVFE